MTVRPTITVERSSTERSTVRLPRVALDRQGERAHFIQYDRILRLNPLADLMRDRFPVCPRCGACALTGEVWRDHMNDCLRCVDGHTLTYDSCMWLWRKRKWTYEDECSGHLGAPPLLRVEFSA